MPELFDKILCPVDFDRNSMGALEVAVKLALQNRAPLCTLHVVPVSLSSLGFPREPYIDLAESEKTKLEKITRWSVPAEVRNEVTVKVGNPAEEIIKAAEDLDVDLIVIATHGEAIIPRFFLGSVAERVVRESTRPVLTVRSRKPAARIHREK